MGVEVRRLVETFATDVAAEGLLPRVDAVVPLEHADRGEALAAHGAAVRLLLCVPAHVDLQLAGEAEALAALLAAVPPLYALARVRGAGGQRLQGSDAFYLQYVRALLAVCAQEAPGCPVAVGGGPRVARSRSAVGVNGRGRRRAAGLPGALGLHLPRGGWRWGRRRM